MQVSITNAEALNLFQMLSNLKVRGNEKFVYAVAKNRSLLKRVVDAVQREANSFADGSERFKEYQRKSDALVREFSVDANGKPIVRDAGDGQSFQRVIPQEKLGDFAKAREYLDAEYKDVILGGQIHQAEFQKYLRDEVAIHLHPLKMKDIPDEAKDTQYMNLMYIFVEESGDEPTANA